MIEVYAEEKTMMRCPLCYYDDNDEAEVECDYGGNVYKDVHNRHHEQDLVS